MRTLIQLMLDSGRVGVDLSLYVILPVMVIMMAAMNVLDKKNVLDWIARKASPFLKPFGLPGLGVFAVLQILFINFAAPVSTLRIIDRKESISDASLAATLAAVLVMAQANAVFPLAAVGLNIPIGVATSLIGGLVASALAYRLSANQATAAGERTAASIGGESAPGTGSADREDQTRSAKGKSIIALLFDGGEHGLAIVLKSIPALVIAVFMVNIFKRAGAIEFLESLFSPILTAIGIPGAAVLPIVTKFIAGGTAMMAILMDMAKEGLISAAELNRVAGFTMNPLDPVGIAVLAATGPRVSKAVKPAIIGAAAGIAVRAILHLVIF